MFKRYLIAACIQTSAEVLRLAENGLNPETALQLPDLSGGVFWTLYGYLPDGRALAVSDCSSLPGALEIYEQITGCKAPSLSADVLLVDLFAPNLKRLAAAGAELAFQIEQMKGMFNDDDGTIEKALDGFYAVEGEIDNANKPATPQQECAGVLPLPAALATATVGLSA